jgi:chemotaxis protein MotB
MAIEEEASGGVPEWVVTFGDMMSLLLTFFIMLVSLSEIKQEEKYQAMADSLRRQFGNEATLVAALPGEHTPMNSMLPHMLTTGRARRQDTASGGNDVQAIQGENLQVQTVRPGKDVTIGGVLFFDEDSAELTEENKQSLSLIARQLSGKPQKIEVRGHASHKPIDPQGGFRDQWDLGYERSYKIAQYLIAQGIEPERIRVGSAAAYEPLESGVEPALRRRNARVEVMLRDERATDRTKAE